jgi:inhibitor of KinA
MPSSIIFRNFEIQASVLSERVLLLTVDNRIDVAVNRLVHNFVTYLSGADLPGIIEYIPAYSSFSICFDPEIIRKHFPQKIPIDAVRDLVFDLMRKIPSEENAFFSRLMEIPVWYNGSDLNSIAGLHQISVHEVIALHAEMLYDVFMIGFLPGFAYMGTVNPKIATPRHASPRQKVPSGSIAIAGMQTGIYPLESPGGWQLIGRTPLRLFDLNAENPCLLKPGDQVKFIPISQSDFMDTHVS